MFEKKEISNGVKKIFVLSLLSLMVLPLMVQAGMTDFDTAGDHGAMWGNKWKIILFSLIYLAVISFIFSLIFWLVHNWIARR